MEDEYVVVEVQWWADNPVGFVVMTRHAWERHYKKSHSLVAEGLSKDEALALANLLRQGERDGP